MRRTRAASSLLPTSGFVLFTACAGMPPGTSSLTDEEREEVEAVLDELGVETPFVDGLLDAADPLFNLEGQPTSSNRELVAGIDGVLADIERMAEADRIVTRPYGEGSDDVESAAHGSRTEGIEADDYIILTLSLEGNLVVTSSRLMHEGTHYFFGAHDSSFVDARDPAMSAQESLALALQYRDAPYMVAHVYEIAATAYDVGADLVEDTRALADMDAYTDEGEAAQQNRQQRFDYLDGLVRLGREGWAQQLAQTLWPSQADILELLGVTQGELQVALSEADELFESHREAAREAMEFWQETFPEFRQEVTQERTGERKRG